MKWIADNLLMPLSGLLVIAIIIFAWKTYRAKKPSKKRNRMKKYMLFSIIACFISVIASISMDPTENNSSSSDKVANVHQHKTVHHSNNWEIQHEMPKTVSKDNMNMKMYVEGEFDAPKYTMNLFVNDQYYKNEHDASTTILGILSDMKKYNYKDFNNVGIVIQTDLQDQYGRNIGYRPIDVYSFKGSDISKMQPLKMNESDLNSIATEHHTNPVSN